VTIELQECSIIFIELQECSIIFVDSPVGTGFSYGRTPAASESSDLKQVDHLHQFLVKVCMQHRIPPLIVKFNDSYKLKLLGYCRLFLLLSYILQWLIDHPEFVSNAFYVGGHSYTGIPIPILVQRISNGMRIKDKVINHDHDQLGGHVL
jgi:serine carboxypeptidase-like clade 1